VGAACKIITFLLSLPKKIHPALARFLTVMRTMSEGAMMNETRTHHRLRDWGDRLCCLALLTAALGGAALLVWYVLHMPALR
jgi:hypothetical protein